VQAGLGWAEMHRGVALPPPCRPIRAAHPPTPIRRPSNADPRLQGLYFVGASTRPGNGVPLCLLGAKLTAERILRDLGR
jgi:phytoene dehydrogenase-like protein